MTEISKEEYEMLKGTVQEHHGRIRKLEDHNSSMPDTSTLRNIEHVIKELPETDALKDAVKTNEARHTNFRRWTWGVISMVSGLVAIALIKLLWEGVGKALAQVGG